MRWGELFAAGLIRRPLLLIYQMGKVGSQTIEATLHGVSGMERIFRPHFLSPEAQAVRRRWRGLNIMPPHRRDNLHALLRESELLYSAVRARRWLRRLGVGGPRINIIAGVREPVSLLLAAMFQNHEIYFEDGGRIQAEACRDLLLLRPHVHPERRQHMDDLQAFVQGWFDGELKRTMGIDVYATPFPHQQGYAIYENRLARVLVYRAEALGRLGQMLSEFLGIARPTVELRNVGAAKEYAAEYQAVKERLRLPESFLRQQYESKLARHFYTEEEREQFRRRWAAQDPGAELPQIVF
jgi:hypothetical protein